MMTTRRTHTPLSLAARLILWFVSINALFGAGSLILFPARTASLFFWEINPPLNAALFGALYLGGSVAVAVAAWRGQWEPARYLVPVLVTAGILLSAVTLLHLDRFNPGLRLYYWLAVYLGAPVLALGIFAHQELRGASWQAGAQPIRLPTRVLAVGLGVALSVVGIVGLLRPGLAAALAPWPIPPLMARVFTAWFSAFAPGLLWFAIEREWSRVSPIATLMVAASVLNLVMLAVHRGDLTPGAPTLWLAVAGYVGLGALGGLMHLLQFAARTWPAGARLESGRLDA